MKKFLIGFVVFILVLCMLSAVGYANPGYVPPSTNDINRTNGWAHVNVIDATVPGEITFEFVQPRDFYACFEYRTDGDTSQVIDEEHFLEFYGVVPVEEGLQQYPYFCLSTISSITETITANEYVEVRMIFGAEGDERFDWTRFDVIPAPKPEPKPIIPEPCDCSLVVLKRDETGNAIDGAVFEVDGIEKTTSGGDARWDNLECDTTYEVRELSPIEQTEGIHLGNCGERSTMRVVNKIEEGELVVAGIEEGELEVLGIMEVLPFTGPAIPYSPFIGIFTVLAGTFLYILSKSKKKR